MFTWALKVFGKVLARRLTNETLRGALREAELRRQLELERHDRTVREAVQARLRATVGASETVLEPGRDSGPGRAPVIVPDSPRLAAPEPFKCPLKDNCTYFCGLPSCAMLIGQGE